MTLQLSDSRETSNLVVFYRQTGIIRIPKKCVFCLDNDCDIYVIKYVLYSLQIPKQDKEKIFASGICGPCSVGTSISVGNSKTYKTYLFTYKVKDFKNMKEFGEKVDEDLFIVMVHNE